MDNYEVAQKIVSELFTNGDGENAKRLVLELENGKNGGAWIKITAFSVIKKILDKESE